MILLDFNNNSSIKYSTAISLALEEEKKLYKKTKVALPLTNKNYNDIRKAFFNLLLQDLEKIRQQFSKSYGNLMICTDYDKDNYWRQQLQPQYKANRDNIKKNDFDKLAYKEFYNHKEEMLQYFKDSGLIVLEKLYTPFLKNSKASIEADDTIAILCTYIKEKHLIISNDGDMSQLLSNTVKIYHPIDRKLVQKTKKEIEEYNQKSLILGQKKDNIFSIKHNSEISKEFIKWMQDKYQIEITQDMLYSILKNYSKYTDEFEKEMYNEDTKNIKDGKRKQRRNLNVFSKANFGEVGYKKLFEAYSINEVLDSNKLYKARYELNKKLYLFTEIPEEIKDCILKVFNEYETKENIYECQTFCNMFGVTYRKF